MDNREEGMTVLFHKKQILPTLTRGLEDFCQQLDYLQGQSVKFSRNMDLLAI